MNGIAESIVMGRHKNSKSARLERKAAILEEASSYSVVFQHHRPINRQIATTKDDETGEITLQTETTITGKRTLTVTTDYIDVPSTYGGSTWAYTLEVDDEGKLWMRVAIAKCRNDELFDPLLGMELALQRYLNGEIIFVETRAERVGPVKAAIEDENYLRVFRCHPR
jgi:hypothetical protein